MTAKQDMRDDVRDLLVEKLEAATYPIREITSLDRGEDEVELIATLSATSVDPQNWTLSRRLSRRRKASSTRPGPRAPRIEQDRINLKSPGFRSALLA